MDYQQLNRVLGNTEFLLVEQILRGEFQSGIRMLDAGCGEGRNMIYFVRNGFSIFGIDTDPESVSMARLVARSVNRSYVAENIILSSIEENPFPGEFFDRLICINVLHAAENDEHFHWMLESLLRLLKKDGRIFIVMESGFGGGLADGFNDPEENERFTGNKMILTRPLLEHVLSKKGIEKTGDIRTYHIEKKISRSGFWLRKK